MKKLPKYFAYVLLLLALLGQGLIPSGFMPDFDSGQSGYNIVICTVDGLKTVRIDTDNQDQEPAHSGHVEATVCNFALHTDFTNTAKDTQLISQALSYTPVVFQPKAYLLSEAFSFSNASSRSPPFFI